MVAGHQHEMFICRQAILNDVMDIIDSRGIVAKIGVAEKVIISTYSIQSLHSVHKDQAIIAVAHPGKPWAARARFSPPWYETLPLPVPSRPDVG